VREQDPDQQELELLECLLRLVDFFDRVRLGQYAEVSAPAAMMMLDIMHELEGGHTRVCWS
jgi:hypothetical protein